MQNGQSSEHPAEDKGGDKSLSVAVVKNISPNTTCVMKRKRPFECLVESTSPTANPINAAPTSVNTVVKDMEEKISGIQTKLEIMERKNFDVHTNIQMKLDALQTDNVELKNSCRSLQNMLTSVLDKHDQHQQDWTYSAEDIPNSYWVSLGFDEDYAHQMALLLDNMKDYTHKLRSGNPVEKIAVAASSSLGGTMLLHNDRLLPHWNELVNALSQYQLSKHHGRQCLALFEIGPTVQLHPKVLLLLAPALKKLHMKELSLKNNRFGRKGVLFLSDILQSNPFLERLTLGINHCESVSDMMCISNSIVSRSAYSPFNTLNLYFTFNGNDPAIMHTLLNSCYRLENLYLNGNDIGSVGAFLIANFLEYNPLLVFMDLDDNHLNDDDVILFANALKSNTNLKDLSLGRNDFTDVGKQALLKVIFDASSLHSCAASNHSCQIEGTPSDSTVDIAEINRRGHSPDNRAMKIFTVLSGTDDGFFNLNCLGDISYKLIPRVLSLAQEFTERTPELSASYFEQTGQRSANWDDLEEEYVPITSVFELLRGWAVPSLS